MRRLGFAVVLACNGSPATPDAMTIDAAGDAAPDTAASLTNRERLIRTYLAYLESTPTIRQSNGLAGSELATTCDLWTRLDPSARAVFLTITARLERSLLRDGSAMLDHVTTLYRAVGGDGATASEPGSCGGGEANRMIMAMDPALHAALRATHDDAGPASDRVIHDAAATSYWRDSSDAGGPHAPFDESDETDGGAPRGQVHYFADPTSAAATSALGRTDLATLVEPYALEMDHDYDCVHASNPLCTYTYYGALCAPAPTRPGVEIFAANYGDPDLAWTPSGCP